LALVEKTIQITQDKHSRLYRLIKTHREISDERN